MKSNLKLRGTLAAAIALAGMSQSSCNYVDEAPKIKVDEKPNRSRGKGKRKKDWQI